MPFCFLTPLLRRLRRTVNRQTFVAAAAAAAGLEMDAGMTDVTSFPLLLPPRQTREAVFHAGMIRKIRQFCQIHTSLLCNLRINSIL